MKHLAKSRESESTPEQAFGQIVRQQREARGWTQEELRARLEEGHGIRLEKTAMIRLESGKRPTRFNEVVALSVLLGLSLSTASFSPQSQLTDEELRNLEEQLEALLRRSFEENKRVVELRQQLQRAIESNQATNRNADLLARHIEEARRWRETVAGQSDGQR
ncbi:helix-turn-helix domain-containing protein [Actinoplanes sp. NPDC051411]|uniref:helix-turn-helix domain-containing protein n=1 Tax=Actinoplanes sp. NPDC051411 TaxID=3155522 RepID=UPI0034274635